MALTFKAVHNARMTGGEYGDIRILQGKHTFTADRAPGIQHTGKVSAGCDLQRGFYGNQAAGTEGAGQDPPESGARRYDRF